MWNPESWALEYGIQFKESGIQPTIGIWDPSSTDNAKSGIQFLKVGIHSMEFIIHILPPVRSFPDIINISIELIGAYPSKLN